MDNNRWETWVAERKWLIFVITARHNRVSIKTINFNGGNRNASNERARRWPRGLVCVWERIRQIARKRSNWEHFNVLLCDKAITHHLCWLMAACSERLQIIHYAYTHTHAPLTCTDQICLKEHHKLPGFWLMFSVRQWLRKKICVCICVESAFFCLVGQHRNEFIPACVPLNRFNVHFSARLFNIIILRQEIPHTTEHCSTCKWIKLAGLWHYFLHKWKVCEKYYAENRWCYPRQTSPFGTQACVPAYLQWLAAPSRWSPAVRRWCSGTAGHYGSWCYKDTSQPSRRIPPAPTPDRSALSAPKPNTNSPSAG